MFIFLAGLAACGPGVEAVPLHLSFACSPSNDLFRVAAQSGCKCARFDTAREAVDRAGPGSAVLVLADGYPNALTKADAAIYAAAARKNLRLYIEYPEMVPGMEPGKPQATVWERAVVSCGEFGDELPKLRILSISGCRYLPMRAADPMVVVARVAGFDTAVFGIPETASPILFKLPDREVYVATTRLSGFVTGRYAPSRDWGLLWQRILTMLDPSGDVSLKWTPTVHPAYSENEKLPADAERRAFAEGIGWYLHGRLLVSEKENAEVEKLLLSGAETRHVPPASEPTGDGSHGILEGYAAATDLDGSQLQRLPLRDDCNAEVAMALALDGSPRTRGIAANLLRYIYVTSGMCGGVRGDPRHPAFGHIAWGAVAPAWTCANYSDDNARGILGTIIAESCLGIDEWNPYVMRALLANLRTTGKLGFRQDRVDIGPIEANGWRAYADAENVNYSPHHSAYLWACNLWAYRQTGYKPFLEGTKNAIKMTMEAYPTGWRWNDSIERARMLLALAWLIRVEDTPEHRAWLKTIADDLLTHQQPCGAIPELSYGQSGDGYHIPQSNEAYGTSETPLIQQNGDPVTDQLYTTGFALFGLHEAVAATGDARLRVCRGQARCLSVPNSGPIEGPSISQRNVVPRVRLQALGLLGKLRRRGVGRVERRIRLGPGLDNDRPRPPSQGHERLGPHLRHRHRRTLLIPAQPAFRKRRRAMGQVMLLTRGSPE